MEQFSKTHKENTENMWESIINEMGN